jgi:hypothetical protein
MANQDPQKSLTVYQNEKIRRIPGWSLNDLALLKFVKENTVRLGNIHRSDRNT